VVGVCVCACACGEGGTSAEACHAKVGPQVALDDAVLELGLACLEHAPVVGLCAPGLGLQPLPLLARVLPAASPRIMNYEY
jgi:hypothetical protein